MVEPFILHGTNIQFCLLRRSGYAEEQFAFRYSDEQPWTVWGNRNDAAAMLFLAGALRLPNTLQAWLEGYYVPGDVVALDPMVGPAKILSYFPNASFKGGVNDVRFANPGEYQIVSPTLNGVSIRLSAEDSLEFYPTFLYIIIGQESWDSWTPVDGDSAEFSKGVDYGRAPW